jgi:hypothetical protein
MSYFGVESNSTINYFQHANNRLIGVRALCGITGEITQVVVYCRYYSGLPGTGDYVKAVITDDSGHILTHGVSNETYITQNEGAGDKVWYWTAGSRPQVASGSYYWIMLIPKTWRMLPPFNPAYTTSTGGSVKYDTSNNYASPTDPTDATNHTFLYKRMLAYVEEAAPVTTYSFLRFRHGGETYAVNCVDQADGAIKIRHNGETYDVKVVDAEDEFASPIKVKVNGEAKALRYYTENGEIVTF